jgi:hypothetical protein
MSMADKNNKNIKNGTGKKERKTNDLQKAVVSGVISGLVRSIVDEIIENMKDLF